MAINQFQMTGDVHVVIRSISAGTINGVTYEANEVITSFTGDVNLNYAEVRSVANTRKTELASNDTFANNLIIIPKQLNEGIYKLIANQKSGDISVPVISSETSNSSGEIYLNAEIDPAFLIIKNTSGQKITNFTVDNENGIISNLSNSTEYKVYYYKITTPITSLTFEGVVLPYLKIELIGKGNINNETKSFLIVVPKAQVNGAPQFSFDNSSIVTVLLECNIINLDAVSIHYY
jgi:curved DNA-binding protein CbpA